MSSPNRIISRYDKNGETEEVTTSLFTDYAVVHSALASNLMRRLDHESEGSVQKVGCCKICYFSSIVITIYAYCSVI